MSIKDEWIALAGELGFEFKEGLRAFTEPKTLYLIAQKEMKVKNVEQAQKFLNHPMVQTLMSKVFMGAAAGRYRDFDFVLLRSSSSSGSSSRNHYVNVALFFNTDLRCDLEIEKGGFWSRLGRKFFSGSYVKLPNNPKMESDLSIMAKDTGQAQVLLTDSRIQAAVANLFAASSGFKITDYGIRHKEKGDIIDKTRALELMDVMAESARAFG